jgi:COP9 signalosome complex subunit 7
MELGSHLAAKLEPFVLMAKSAKGAAAAKLIQDATSAQGVYFFAELLDAPNIKEVRRTNRPRAHVLIASFSSRAADSTKRTTHC